MGRSGEGACVTELSLAVGQIASRFHKIIKVQSKKKNILPALPEVTKSMMMIY